MLSSHVTRWLQLQLDTDSVQSWCDANVMNRNRSKTRVSLLYPWVINVKLCTLNCWCLLDIILLLCLLSEYTCYMELSYFRRC